MTRTTEGCPTELCQPTALLDRPFSEEGDPICQGRGMVFGPIERTKSHQQKTMMKKHCQVRKNSGEDTMAKNQHDCIHRKRGRRKRRK